VAASLRSRGYPRCSSWQLAPWWSRLLRRRATGQARCRRYPLASAELSQGRARHAVGVRLGVCLHHQAMASVGRPSRHAILPAPDSG
jgi:hypothetical protein